MAKLFESLTPRRRNPNTPSVVQTSSEDLAAITTKVQQRQQQLLANNPMTGAGSPFPIQQTPGTLPDLLGKGRHRAPQPNGLPGVTNIVPNQAVEGVRSGRAADAVPVNVGPPVAPPVEIESTPKDVAYTELTPTQRNRALMSTGMTVQDAAVNPETGRTWRTSTGAAVLAFNPGIPVLDGDRLFLAEDGAAAHSAAIQALQELGVQARPGSPSSDGGKYPGYSVEWEVPDEARDLFAGVMGYLEPSEVTYANGRFRVAFSPDHPVNRDFMERPFGSSKAAG